MLLSSAASLLAGCNSPDSSFICSSGSKESIFARSLSQSQLQTLYSGSLKLMVSSERTRIYRYFNEGSARPQIPAEFAYLRPIRIDVLDHEYVSIMLNGCMDAFIDLTVKNGDVTVSYS